jgi:hypothetical protein
MMKQFGHCEWDCRFCWIRSLCVSARSVTVCCSKLTCGMAVAHNVGARIGSLVRSTVAPVAVPDISQALEVYILSAGHCGGGRPSIIPTIVSCGAPARLRAQRFCEGENDGEKDSEAHGRSEIQLYIRGSVWKPTWNANNQAGGQVVQVVAPGPENDVPPHEKHDVSPVVLPNV